MSLPTARIFLVATLLAFAAFLSPAGGAESPTAELEYPLERGKLLMADAPAPNRRRVSFRGSWKGERGTVFNPAQAISSLHVVGGPGEGDSGVIQLVSGRWKPLKRAAGFRYSDPAGSAGGIRGIILRIGQKGGSLKIIGGRANWAYALDRPQTEVSVTLTIGRARWCAAFRSPLRRGGPRQLVATSRTAPSSCPCNATFEGTWETIQAAVFERYGCSTAVCHGSAASGGLDLRPEVAYRNLVDVPSTAVPGQKRVEPGDQNRSLLWRKLAKGTLGGFADVPGVAMPNGASPLSREELDAVALWIRAGAAETGIVARTDQLLALCLPPPDPIKIRAPEPPPVSEGVQLYGPPWTIPAQGENEICYATYYDFSAVIPAEHQIPCPDFWGGPGKSCFFYHRTELTQDPNSHHSIIHAYRGVYDVSDPGFGPFTCHGGAQHDLPCDPKGIGVPAPAGADCGAGGACAGRVVPAVACIGYGPPDFQLGLNFPVGVDFDNAPTISIATQPLLSTRFASGVFAILPVSGVTVWNSHAFNVSDQATTNEQWLNIYFAGTGDRRYPVQDLFDADDIFVQKVPPFAEREYCRTHTFDKGTRLFEVSSHTHKRGRLFRVWGPGIAPPCSSKAGDVCNPEASTPVLVTTDYSDPALVVFDPPVELDGDDPASRTYKFCAIYDNGFTDPSTVRRATGGPPLATFCPPAKRHCLAGPNRGQPCGGDNAVCNTPGQQDGLCDACPLEGGITTDDEMFILLGSYYCVEGSSCFKPAL